MRVEPVNCGFTLAIEFDISGMIDFHLLLMGTLDLAKHHPSLFAAG